MPVGPKTLCPEKVKKSQNAHGLSAYEAKLTDKGWQMVRPSRYARRFTMTQNLPSADRQPGTC
jgi:secreted PhoX family phosphatase